MPARVASWIRALVAIMGIGVAVTCGAHNAFAWVELTVSSDDVRVSVDPLGRARVEHRVTLLVSGGPLREVLIKGVDADAEAEKDGYVILEKDASKKGLEGSFPISVERVIAPSPDTATPARTDLKVTLAPGEGIRRGAYVLFVRYATDLRKQGALSVDGASSQIRWTGPSWDDGLDATKAIFELPAAPTAPKAQEPTDDDAPGSDGGTLLSNVHRDGKNDIVELARPYASKGERVQWTLRVDSRAFESEQPITEKPKHARESTHGLRIGAFGNPRDGILLGLGLALFAVMALLVAAKSVEVRRLAAERGGKETPLVPLPMWLRAPLSGLALVTGVFLEMTHQSSLPGALVVALAALLATQRAPTYKSPLRGPGQWLSVSVTEALREGPPIATARFDASTWMGRLFLMTLIGVAACGAWLTWPTSRYYAILIALDIAPFLAVFLTGRLNQLSPDPAAAPVPFFRKTIRLVQQKQPTARVVPRLRMPLDCADADELRIALLPTRPLSGLFALELGVSYAPGLGGYTMFPELLIRYMARSACETRALSLGHHGRIRRGRRPDERVLSISPKLPTARMTADLVVALLESLSGEGRASIPPKSNASAVQSSPKRSIAA